MSCKDLKRVKVSDENGVLAFEAFKYHADDVISIDVHSNSSGLFTFDQTESIAKQLLQLVASAKKCKAASAEAEKNA